MKLTERIYHVGVDDHKIDLFEGQYAVPNGMSYQSYVISDEKIAVLDTVDAAFVDEWLDKLDAALEGKEPDYLIVQHMEPDHSSGICRFAERYPSSTVVSNAKSFGMMKAFFGFDKPERCLAVAEGDTLPLGRHTLQFIAAPMVHWPEVMMSYEQSEKILFSADAFGKFGASDANEDWACEARRYYFGIVGKYGNPVQNVLKKAAGLEIRMICPLHGPVLKENLDYYLNLYRTWSSWDVEEKGVAIAYTSVYGNTKRAVQELAAALKEKGCKVTVNDLARCDMAEAVEDAFRYDRLVLATTTYNGEIFPFMREFIHHLTERSFQKRTVAFIENGSWAPMAARVMRSMLEGCQEIRYCENNPRILSALNDESRQTLRALAEELTR